MSARVLFAGLFHETHTFLEERTAWRDFDVAMGEAIFAKRGDASPTDGFLEVADAAGWEVIPTIDARAMPSGMVEDAAFEDYWRAFEERAQPALAEGVDAIYLVLHGAMVTGRHRDAEGEFLSRLRSLSGAEAKPIFGVFDLHANFSFRMAKLTQGLVAYQENPHSDARAAAVRAAHLLERCLRDGTVPRMTVCQLPMVWPPPGTGTASSPMLELEQRAREWEQKVEGVWAANVVGGYAFADTGDTGVSLGIIHDGNDAGVRAVLREGAELAWALREQGCVEYQDVNDVLDAGLDGLKKPVLLVEPSDNIGGGAPGDGTGVLRALLRADVQNALVVINDPTSVEQLRAVNPGEPCSLCIGGKTSRLDEGPVAVEVILRSRSDGRFALEDKQSHLASMLGENIDMGPSAVVTTGGVTVLLTSRKTPPFDLGQLRSQGLEPQDFDVIGVKAAVAHRRAYDRLGGTSFWVETPGPCSSRLARFDWQHLRRPVFPLDPISHPHFSFL